MVSFFASCHEEYSSYVYSYDRNTQVLDIELNNRMHQILESEKEFPNLIVEKVGDDIILKGNVSFERNTYKDEIITYYFVNFRITPGEFIHSQWVGRVDVKVEKTTTNETFECTLEY